ncbi:hypothetical protein DL767_008828 [Monosporascus sp. MG133]|nr:hypothetical protein DL767_008828 [Monosporascus sp. MG133]
MGGFGFRRKGNDLNLDTPRMPPHVYRHIREKVHAALRQRFLVVASPIESPGKIDYGDVDVFVCWDTVGRFGECDSVQAIRKCLDATELENIRLLVGAAHALVERKQNVTAQLAIPWPETAGMETTEESRPRLAQIDFHICCSLQDLEWQIFQCAHGDIFWFMHTMLRPFGLTLGVAGLQLRIAEIEDETNNHEIFLSNQSSEILKFLGLRPEGIEWERPFQSNDGLFDYASTCRFFHDFGDENLSEADRKRMRSRKVYRTWVEEFLPTYRARGSFRGTVPSRAQVRDDAMKFFSGPRLLRTSKSDKEASLFFSVKEAYHARRLAFRRDQQIDLYPRVILPCLYDQLPKVLSVNWLGNAGRALQSIIMEGDHGYGTWPVKPLKTPEGLYLESDIREYIRNS